MGIEAVTLFLVLVSACSYRGSLFFYVGAAYSLAGVLLCGHIKGL